MAKAKSVFICQQCGYESPRWLGKCPECGTWNSLVESVVKETKQTSRQSSRQSSGINLQKLSEVNLAKSERIKTKIDEFDQILGGGIVPGQMILLAGAPGIGKSTLLLQIANNLSDVLYMSGEESINQIAIRAKRLGVKSSGLSIGEDTDIDNIIETAQAEKPKALIIDSIQTMATEDLTGMAGSVGQVRECAFRLVRFAKSTGTPVFVVGHVTKEGSVAGPSVLAHIVDTVLWFEGDKDLTVRMVRAVKNRFGPTDNTGVFEMKEGGLVSVIDPEKIFLNKKDERIPGSATGAIMQGTRPMLVEVEGLVVPSKLAFPKRIAQGIDAKRFELLLAVLTRRCNLPLYEYDCYINIAGGVIARTPSIDVAICTAIASSFFDKPIKSGTLAVGEVGLLGEIRQVAGEEKITALGKKLGMENIINGKQYRYLTQVIHNLFDASKRTKR